MKRVVNTGGVMRRTHVCLWRPMLEMGDDVFC